MHLNWTHAPAAIRCLAGFSLAGMNSQPVTPPSLWALPLIGADALLRHKGSVSASRLFFGRPGPRAPFLADAWPRGRTSRWANEQPHFSQDVASGAPGPVFGDGLRFKHLVPPSAEATGLRRLGGSANARKPTISTPCSPSPRPPSALIVKNDSRTGTASNQSNLFARVGYPSPRSDGAFVQFRDSVPELKTRRHMLQPQSGRGGQRSVRRTLHVESRHR